MNRLIIEENKSINDEDVDTLGIPRSNSPYDYHAVKTSASDFNKSLKILKTSKSASQTHGSLLPEMIMQSKEIARNPVIGEGDGKDSETSVIAQETLACESSFSLNIEHQDIGNFPNC
jgi:hypothetical protein